jgi:hypothetical protein
MSSLVVSVNYASARFAHADRFNPVVMLQQVRWKRKDGYACGRAFNNTFLAVALSSTAVFTGASLGSLCCFLLGRYLFRQPVMHLAENYPIFQAIDRGTCRGFILFTRKIIGMSYGSIPNAFFSQIQRWRGMDSRYAPSMTLSSYPLQCTGLHQRHYIYFD